MYILDWCWGKNQSIIIVIQLDQIWALRIVWPTWSTVNGHWPPIYWPYMISFTSRSQPHSNFTFLHTALSLHLAYPIKGKVKYHLILTTAVPDQYFTLWLSYHRWWQAQLLCDKILQAICNTFTSVIFIIISFILIMASPTQLCYTWTILLLYFIHIASLLNPVKCGLFAEILACLLKF